MVGSDDSRIRHRGSGIPHRRGETRRRTGCSRGTGFDQRSVVSGGHDLGSFIWSCRGLALDQPGALGERPNYRKLGNFPPTERRGASIRYRRLSARRFGRVSRHALDSRYSICFRAVDGSYLFVARLCDQRNVGICNWLSTRA